MTKALKPWKKGQREENRRELKFSLDEGSVERLERLRSKIQTLDDDDLIASALKSLENKTDRIIRKQVQRKVKTLRKEGFNLEQIADHLNKKNIPAVGASNWTIHAISSLLKETGSQSGKVTDAPVQNH
jgi:hypothetical protein